MYFVFFFSPFTLRAGVCVCVAHVALGKQTLVGVTAWQGTCLDVEVFDGQWRY